MHAWIAYDSEHQFELRIFQPKMQPNYPTSATPHADALAVRPPQLLRCAMHTKLSTELLDLGVNDSNSKVMRMVDLKGSDFPVRGFDSAVLSADDFIVSGPNAHRMVKASLRAVARAKIHALFHRLCISLYTVGAKGAWVKVRHSHIHEGWEP